MRMVPALSAALMAATAMSVAPAAAAPADRAPVKVPGPPDGKVDFSLSPSRSHCSTRVLSPEQMKAGAKSDIRCYPTEDQARVAVGLRALDGTVESTERARQELGATIDEQSGAVMAQAQSDYVWAQHYDFNGYGATLVITGGSFCDGSGLVLSAGDGWNDRISSTRPHHCGKVKHFEHWDQSGAQQNALGSGMLTPLNSQLNNQVSSTSYHA